MTRVDAAAGILLWAGLALLLSSGGPLARRRLSDRLRPHSPWPGDPPAGGGPGASDPVSRVLWPLAQAAGDRASALLGSGELAARLARVHADTDTGAFRLRQLLLAVGALVAAGGAMAVVRPPSVVGLLALPVAVIGAYASTELSLNRACQRWDQRRRHELPVVTEQLAMLVAAGYSLATAVGRIADRGHGAVATDLRDVNRRLGSGVSQHQALAEWQARASCDAVDRLVALLTVAQETTDVGRLLSDEARSLRRDLHRQTLETMERRAQQVWIPVTVAALIPGVVLIAVPFVEALRLFSSA